jgi:hypothetical protein
MKDTFDTSGTALLLELAHAFNRNGWTPANMKWLTEGDRLKSMLPLVLGTGQINIVKHVIDLDADPHLPNDWKVEEHKKGGQFEWDPAKVKFHLSKSQTDGKSIEGNKLRKELANEPVFNANLLDYLLKNPLLIPDEWKKDEQGNTRYIFFWGTIYRHSDGHLCVRCLCWRGGEWVWDYGWLGSGWDAVSPAASLAK